MIIQSPRSISELTDIAAAIRREVIEMTNAAHCGHIGSALSTVDILTALYFRTLHVNPQYPDWPNRDRFILSKGHGAAAYYAVLAYAGFFPKEVLRTYLTDGSPLGVHPSVHGIPGVEFSTGSLGHGLPVGAGMAYAAQTDGRGSRVFVLLSDGECDEGSTWEAALFAGHHHLENLTAIIDYNKFQAFGRTSEVLNLEPFRQKWEAFGFDAMEIDGHDTASVVHALEAPTKGTKPKAIIAHTVIGRGVSFMEDRLAWHYNFMTSEQYAKAVEELS